MITKLLDATKWQGKDSLCKKYDSIIDDQTEIVAWHKLYIILKIYIVYASELSIMFDVCMDHIVMIAYMNVLHSKRRSDQLSNGTLILTNSVVIYVNAD
jgi:hypothetical protein